MNKNWNAATFAVLPHCSFNLNVVYVTMGKSISANLLLKLAVFAKFCHLLVTFFIITTDIVQITVCFAI